MAFSMGRVVRATLYRLSTTGLGYPKKGAVARIANWFDSWRDGLAGVVFIAAAGGILIDLAWPSAGTLYRCANVAVLLVAGIYKLSGTDEGLEIPGQY